MFVLTVDQRGSRRDVDRVAALLDELRDADLLRPFERTAGDEVQAVADDAETVVDLALDLVRRGHWSVGIGVGSVETPLPEQTRAGRGPAFEHARTAVERAKNAPGNLAVEGTDSAAAADADAALTLLATLVLRRTRSRARSTTVSASSATAWTSSPAVRS
uniref:SatD family protein n=1 Tax=Rhodococcus zopfii TaxID=43772 RepID=UPI001EE07EEA